MPVQQIGACLIDLVLPEVASHRCALVLEFFRNGLRGAKHIVGAMSTAVGVIGHACRSVLRLIIEAWLCLQIGNRSLIRLRGNDHAVSFSPQRVVAARDRESKNACGISQC